MGKWKFKKSQDVFEEKERGGENWHCMATPKFIWKQSNQDSEVLTQGQKYATGRDKRAQKYGACV